MTANNPAVDPTTSQVEAIADFLIQFAGYNLRADHLLSCSAFASLRTAISTISAWDTPSFFANSLINAIASGVRRKLVASLFAILGIVPHYELQFRSLDHNSAKAQRKTRLSARLKPQGLAAGLIPVNSAEVKLSPSRGIFGKEQNTKRFFVAKNAFMLTTLAKTIGDTLVAQ